MTESALGPGSGFSTADRASSATSARIASQPVLQLSASNTGDPGLDLATLVVLAFTAVAAAAAAVAAFRAVAATRDAAEIARTSALLATVPLLVPWTSNETGQIQVVNRGGSVSHSLRWSITIGEEEIAEDADQLVIPPLTQTNKKRDLVLTDSAMKLIVDWHVGKRPVPMKIECRYQASWGQEFITTRTYPAGSTDSEIKITDKHNNELKLE